MHHAILAGRNFDERAVGLDAHDLAGVDAADLDFLGHLLDFGQAPARRPWPSAPETNTEPSSSMSILTLYCSCRPRIILPPGPITLPIFSGSMCVGQDARRIAPTGVLRGSGSTSSILPRMNKPALARLRQRLFQDLVGQAVDLDVHLQGGDAMLGAGHLEVHVAQVIFQALDVAQDRVAQALRWSRRRR